MSKASKTSKKPAHKWIEDWADEREQGNSLIVTLIPGRKFSDDPLVAEHVRGFDSVKEAMAEVRTSMECECDECQRLTAKSPTDTATGAPEESSGEASAEYAPAPADQAAADPTSAGAVVPVDYQYDSDDESQEIEQEEVPDAVPGFRVPSRLIAAALLVAARHDVRQYLCGVYLHAVDGDLRIVATDGHRMVVSRMPLPEDAELPEWAKHGVILPRDKVAEVLPLLKRNAIPENVRIYTRHDPLQAEIVIRDEPASKRVVLASPNGFASFAVRPIDATFPDYAKVIAASAVNLARGEGEALMAPCINTAYLKGAAEVAERVGARGVHAFISGKDDAATFFTFDGAPDTCYVVMPMRGVSSHAVSDGVVRIVGHDGMKASLAALRAHRTRTAKALKDATTDREREQLEAKRQAFSEKIDRILANVSKVPQIENRA